MADLVVMEFSDAAGAEHAAAEAQRVVSDHGTYYMPPWLIAVDAHGALGELHFHVHRYEGPRTAIWGPAAATILNSEIQAPTAGLSGPLTLAELENGHSLRIDCEFQERLRDVLQSRASALVMVGQVASGTPGDLYGSPRRMGRSQCTILNTYLPWDSEPIGQCLTTSPASDRGRRRGTRPGWFTPPTATRQPSWRMRREYDGLNFRPASRAKIVERLVESEHTWPDQRTDCNITHQ